MGDFQPPRRDIPGEPDGCAATAGGPRVPVASGEPRLHAVEVSGLELLEVEAAAPERRLHRAHPGLAVIETEVDAGLEESEGRAVLQIPAKVPEEEERRRVPGEEVRRLVTERRAPPGLGRRQRGADGGGRRRGGSAWLRARERATEEEALFNGRLGGDIRGHPAWCSRRPCRGGCRPGRDGGGHMTHRGAWRRARPGRESRGSCARRRGGQRPGEGRQQRAAGAQSTGFLGEALLGQGAQTLGVQLLEVVPCHGGQSERFL
jgi:hypothetical protein